MILMLYIAVFMMGMGLIRTFTKAPQVEIQLFFLMFIVSLGFYLVLRKK